MDYEDFLSKLGSGTPVPGGGSASAMVGSISAALSKMVANLTIGKKGYEEQEGLMKYAVSEIEKIEKRFLSLAKEDEDAFNEISASWRLPKETEQEKKTRKDSIRAATLNAMKPPWAIASAAVTVLEISNKLIETGNKNAISDAACSAEFALATVRSALHNVRINLAGIKDPETVENENMKLKLLLEQADSLYRKALESYKNRTS